MNHQESELDAHPDAHYHHALNNLPEWLLQASSTTREALKSAPLDTPLWHAGASSEQRQAMHLANQQHLSQRSRLEATLSHLKNARDFAEPLLKEALKKRFNLDLDVKTNFLRLYIPQNMPQSPIKSGGPSPWTVSLLEAVLHNFQESETLAEAYESASTFITQPSPAGQFDTLPAHRGKLSPQDFIRLCRQLDIGGQYQAYLKDCLGFSNPLTAADLQSKVQAAQTAALGSALQLARLRGDLPDDAYQAINAIVHDGKDVKLAGQTLCCHDLNMMSSTLTGIVIFAPELDAARKTKRVVVYIPDDPQHPLKQYPDADAFMTDLSRKLREPRYQTFFSRFVDHRERGHFFADINRSLSHVTRHQSDPGDALPSWHDTPVDKLNLQYSVRPTRTTLWTHLYQRQLDKILNDARVQAVPTADADRNPRWALRDTLSTFATGILQATSCVAIPFVPLLGEVVLAYMASQILDETFEGSPDWTDGLKKQAFEHTMTFVETVIELGAFAIGASVAGNALRHLMSAECRMLIASLKPVAITDGKTRYWNPDLGPYEQSIELPAEARPDPLGLYQYQDKTLLRLENKLYSVKTDTASGRFQIEHPHRAEAYQPPLRHNGHGAWQTVLDQPLCWDRETVMRRLGHSVESFSSAEREQILRISGFHDNVLREIHVDNHRPPSLLTDTIKRFKIDRDIQALAEPSASDDPDHYQALHQRKSLFESRYLALEKTADRQARLLVGEVHGLPTDIAQELVSNASGSELMQLHQERVPRRLTDVAVKALEAVRAARAYEGFYLEGMESTDTHRLALHSLQSSPDWPADWRIDLREYSPEGTMRDSIGEPDASTLGTLVQAEDGSYHVYGKDGLAGNFYQALLQALPPAGRDRLGMTIDDESSLKLHIVELAANQPRLRTLFARHPQRKPFYDPTTLRLPGGTAGYSRSGGPTSTLHDRVREVYPGIGEEELRASAAGLQHHPDGAWVELSRLGNELEQLHQDLHKWIAEAPTAHPQTAIALSDVERQAQQHNRRLLAQELHNSWRRQSPRDVDLADGDARYVLRFEEPLMGDLPPLTADFSHVSVLTLEGSHAEHGMHAFLQRFKELRHLELRRFALSTLPDGIQHMPNLETLVLNECAIRFDAPAWSRICSLKKLTVLDVFRSSFKETPDIASMPQLVHLDLSDTGLTDVPESTLHHRRIDTLRLMNNRITELPAELFDSAVYEKRGVHLSHNPLTDRARQLIKHQYFETSYDMGVDAPQADVDRVMSLYPRMDAEQASEFVYELTGTLEDGRAELTNLETQLAQLSHDLSAWAADLPLRHPLTGEPFTAHQELVERVSREEFKQTLEQCWRHEGELDDFNETLEPTFELVIHPGITGELPTLSADFSHVSSLTLESANGVTRMGRFLESFPNLKNLRLRNCDLGDLPDAVLNRVEHTRPVGISNPEGSGIDE